MRRVGEEEGGVGGLQAVGAAGWEFLSPQLKVQEEQC